MPRPDAKTLHGAIVALGSGPCDEDRAAVAAEALDTANVDDLADAIERLVDEGQAILVAETVQVFTRTVRRMAHALSEAGHGQ